MNEQYTRPDWVIFEKEILLYIFGCLILLYVMVAVYNRVKRPKKEIQTVTAKVTSVVQSRVQTNHRDTGFDQLMSGGAAIPGTHFEVTLINVENDEVYVFTISKSVSEKLSVGKIGELCFKGDEFICFGSEQEQGKSEKIYYLKKRVLPLAICGVFAIGLSVWAVIHFFSNNDTQIEIEEAPKDLKIYMFSHALYHGNEIISNTSRYNLGEFRHLTEKWGDSAYMYYDAIESYIKDTGKEIEIEFFDSPRDMFERAYEEWRNGKGPDVMIGDYSNNGCLLYPYISEGMFADMSGYFEEDALYSSREYAAKVLEAGRIGNEQLVFPLTFNMNMLYTSEERMKKHGIWLSEDMLYEEMMTVFQDEWDSVRDEDEYLMLQLVDNMYNRHPVLLFQSASGLNMIDYETGEIQLSLEDFSDWASLYESYVCNEYQLSREELKEFAVQNPDIWIPQEKSNIAAIIELCNNAESYDVIFDITKENTFCWSNGGAWASHYHPFASNTNYYESRMKDEGENFVPIAIPCKQNPDEYAAEVTSFGVILSNSKNPEDAYEFIKALADHKHFMHLDLSVNRQVLTDTLEELAMTNFSLRLRVAGIEPPQISEKDLMNHDEEAQKAIDIYNEESYLMQAMSEETKEYLMNMVDHIGVASLPEGQLDVIIIEEMGEYIWGEVETVEEAYMNTLQRFVEMEYESK